MSDVLMPIRMKRTGAYVKKDRERERVSGSVVIHEFGRRLGSDFSRWIYFLDFVWDGGTCLLKRYDWRNCSESNPDFDKFANLLEQGKLVLRRDAKDGTYKAVAV